MSRNHALKVWPEYFNQIATGQKTFEIRFNDRRFQPGDMLMLEEWSPTTADYTGRWTTRRVGFVFDPAVDSVPGVQPGYVVLSLLTH